MPGIVVRPATSDELGAKMLLHMADVQAEVDKLRAENAKLTADREVLLGTVNAVWQAADRHMGEVDAMVLRNVVVRIRNMSDRAIAEVQKHG